MNTTHHLTATTTVSTAYSISRAWVGVGEFAVRWPCHEVPWWKLRRAYMRGFVACNMHSIVVEIWSGTQLSLGKRKQSSNVSRSQIQICSQCHAIYGWDICCSYGKASKWWFGPWFVSVHHLRPKQTNNKVETSKIQNIKSYSNL